jgi:hypothetical protein
MAQKLLKVRLTLKGRPVRALVINKDCVTVGRDPGSDIFLDNPGISREHCKIELTPSGEHRIEDLGSANGMFVNDNPVKSHIIRNNDVVLIGKFALWFTYEEDRRGEQNAARRLASTQDEGTTVLRTAELQEMIETLRDAESSFSQAVATPSATAPARAASRRTRSLVVLGFLLAFAAGYVAGGGLRWVPWHAGLGALAGSEVLDPAVGDAAPSGGGP